MGEHIIQDPQEAFIRLLLQAAREFTRRTGLDAEIMIGSQQLNLGWRPIAEFSGIKVVCAVDFPPRI